MDAKTIDITVKYTGANDFHDVVHGDPVFRAIKLEAMHAFGIEPSAAGNYVLQYHGADLNDEQHVSSLHEQTLVLVLTLLKEPPKG